VGGGGWGGGGGGGHLKNPFWRGEHEGNLVNLLKIVGLDLK